MKISIIIPTIYNFAHTYECLNSLYSFKPNIKFEVIIINSLPSEEEKTISFGNSLFKESFIYLYSNDKSFGSACYKGAAVATGDFLFFISNDSMFTDNWLEPLLTNFITQKNIFAARPILVYPNIGTLKDRVSHMGFAITPTIKLANLYEGIPAEHELAKKPRLFSFSSLNGLLINKKNFIINFRKNNKVGRDYEYLSVLLHFYDINKYIYFEPRAKIYQRYNSYFSTYLDEINDASILLHLTKSRIVPNLQTYFESDNLKIGLSNWLTFYPESTHEHFKINYNNIDEIISTLNKNPFWYDGYNLIIEKLREDNNWKEIVAWREIVVKLRLDPDTILSLLIDSYKSNDDKKNIEPYVYLEDFFYSKKFLLLLAEIILTSSKLNKIDDLTLLSEKWIKNSNTFEKNILEPTIKKMLELKKTKEELNKELFASYSRLMLIKKYLRSDKDKQKIDLELLHTRYQPLLSILMPVYNPNLSHLEQAIESIRKQSYTKWQLCIADDASTDKEVVELLEKYKKLDSRIEVVFRSVNGHISAASNSALSIAKGEYIVLMDQDDVIVEDALLEVVFKLNKHPNAMLLYSDEDKINEYDLLLDPIFKFPFDFELICSMNFFSHLGVFNANLLRDVGGFRIGYEGSQDHDLVLRCIEKINIEQIVYIPKVLYHWRLHDNSTSKNSNSKPYANDSRLMAVKDYLKRNNLNAEPHINNKYSFVEILYNLPSPLPTVSIITKCNNFFSYYNAWIENFLNATSYPCLEIISLINHKYELTTTDNRIKKIYVDNQNLYDLQPALKMATGQVIGHINTGLMPYEKNWLDQIVANLERHDVGAVSSRIFNHSGINKNSGFGITNDKRVYPIFSGCNRDEFNNYISFDFSRNVLLSPKESFFSIAENFKLFYSSEYKHLWSEEMCMQMHKNKLKVLNIPYSDLYYEKKMPSSLKEKYNYSNENSFISKWEKILMRNTLNYNLEPNNIGTYSISKTFFKL